MFAASEVPPHIWEMFRCYRWPGNVRELRNAVQRMLVTPDWVLHADVPAGEDAPVCAPSASDSETVTAHRVARREAVDAFERNYLTTQLARADN